MVVKGNGGSALQVQRPDVQRCHEHTPWGNDGRLVLHNHRMLDLETMWLDLGWLPLNGMNTVPILFFSLVWWTNDGMECIDKLTNVRKVWKCRNRTPWLFIGVMARWWNGMHWPTDNVRKVWKCRNRMPRLFIGMMDQWWNGMHWKTDDKRQNRLEMPELGSGQWRSQKEKAEGLSPNSLTRERDKTRLFLGCSDGRKWSVCSRLPPCRCTFLSFFKFQVFSSFSEFFVSKFSKLKRLLLYCLWNSTCVRSPKGSEGSEEDERQLPVVGTRTAKAQKVEHHGTAEPPGAASWGGELNCMSMHVTNPN